MMGAEYVFENLSAVEKTAIMAVLSRDRQLRETEEERVMKLRIDLAKERRAGALVAGRDTAQKKRTCARCRGQVGILQSARCPMCKHIICKKCRVLRPRATMDTAQGDNLINQKQKADDIGHMLRTASDSSYPTELNPFETDRTVDATRLANTPVGKSSEKSVNFTLGVPTIQCEVIDDDVNGCDAIPMTSTPYDPHLGRSLVGGDTGNMTLPENLTTDSDVHHSDIVSKSFSDKGHTRLKRKSLQLSKTGTFDGPHDEGRQINARRKLHDEFTPPSTSKSHNARKSMTTLKAPYSILPGSDDSDDKHVHSDSSAYVTAGVSPSTGNKPATLAPGDDNFSGLPKKSNSTGYLPDFDEKAAVEFLMQIGTKYTKPVESSPDTEESADDLPQLETSNVGENELAKTQNPAEGFEILNIPQSAKKQDDKPVRKNPISILSSALEVIAKDFSNDNILSKPPLDPNRRNSFASFLSKPLGTRLRSNDVVAKFKGLIGPKKSVETQQKTPDKESTAKLFKMASNPDPEVPNASSPAETGFPKADAIQPLEPDQMDAIDISDPQSEKGLIVNPLKVNEVRPLERAQVDSLDISDAQSDKGLRVSPRQCRSNPNSPYRSRKNSLSAPDNDNAVCISEASAPNSEDECYRNKETSSSDAPSTSSSEEYYYVRRKSISSNKTHKSYVPIKDSGYSTRETYLQARNRSRYMRATRLSRRARVRERDLRRLGKKSLRERLPRDFISSRRDTSSDLSDFSKPESLEPIRPPENGAPLEALSANTNMMGGMQGTIGSASSQESIVKSQSSTPDANQNQHTTVRKSSSARIVFQQITNKMRSKSLEEEWVCKVCDKSLDVRKKSGDWFYKNTRPEVLQFKEHLVNTKRRLSGDPPLSFRMSERLQHRPSPLTFDPAAVESGGESHSLLPPPISRVRSNTLPSSLNYVISDVQDLHKTPSSASLAEESVDKSQCEANIQRQRLRIGRKSVAEVLHGTLLYHVPDPLPAGAPPPFVKKQTSVVEKTVIPACIENKPDDAIIFRGNPISLCCTLSGTPPLKSVWRKGKNEIKSSSQCCLDITDTSAALTIKKSERDDSGCYILQVKNAAGVDQYSINVSVVDVPDPPGQPYASDLSGSSLVVSWYGTGYDGGSTITGYKVEMADVSSSTKAPKWNPVATAKSTSCTVQGLQPNCKYIFRVCAENMHGCSSPGLQSDVVLNTVTDVAESSEDEETFVKHDTVTVKIDGSFAQKYETKERLGQGRFGKVHRVVNRDSGKEYAAKIMRALKAKDKEAVQQEIDIMNSLRHPRLVQLIDAYSHGREITMVMDLVSGGELFERVIDEDFELTEAACIKYMSQICDGLKYMHDALILHLDLKPENIMCINKTGTQVKIIDFGLARRYNPRETIRVMFGTPEFVAPEVINYDAIGPQTDMWSVGVICYILLSGLSPFMGDNDAETLSNITAVEWDFEDEAFDDISHDAKDFIRHLLVKNLNKRYTVDKALEHKWFKKDTEKMAKSKLNTKNLKRFLARRKWQKTGNAVRALGRLASLANLGSSNSNPNKISNGQPRESGFLAALKAQLLRENEEEQDGPTNCKPIFETLFDDVEVIEGSAARFECTIMGTPDPEIMWFKDGEPIKESRHFRISYTEDDVCTLLITDATEADEAEYTCKAVNCEGETEHRAELIVITPGV